MADIPTQQGSGRQIPGTARSPGADGPADVRLPHPPEPDTQLHLAVDIVGGRRWVSACGPVDVSGAPSLAGVLRDATGPGRQVLVDLSRVTFLAEAGLRVLVDAHRRLAACGGELILTGAGVRIRRLWQLTGDDRLLHLQPVDLRHGTTGMRSARAAGTRR